jgi:hypothetical protein
MPTSAVANLNRSSRAAGAMAKTAIERRTVIAAGS